MGHLVLALILAACNKPIGKASEPPSGDVSSPSPPPPADAAVRVDAATQLVVRVSAVDVVGADTFVIIGRGTQAGIAKDWNACLVDDNDQCAPHGELTVIRLEPGMTTLRAHSAQLVRSYAVVKLSAPSP